MTDTPCNPYAPCVWITKAEHDRNRGHYTGYHVHIIEEETK